jgi:hypothetical protein
LIRLGDGRLALLADSHEGEFERDPYLMPPLGLYVNKLQRNMVYEAIAQTGIDPGQFDLEAEDKLLVTHNAGSTFEAVWSDERRIYRIRSKGRRALIIKAIVKDGTEETYTIPGRFKYVLPSKHSGYLARVDI